MNNQRPSPGHRTTSRCARRTSWLWIDSNSPHLAHGDVAVWVHLLLRLSVRHKAVPVLLQQKQRGQAGCSEKRLHRTRLDGSGRDSKVLHHREAAAAANPQR